jgi:hypothetical protein
MVPPTTSGTNAANDGVHKLEDAVKKLRLHGSDTLEINLDGAVINCSDPAFVRLVYAHSRRAQ